jgi:1-aminocyclopropane-1-carboxylate deaminase
MNDFFLRENIPSDFVYTGKMFYAAESLIASNYFASGSKILLVHTGGLQGNRSFPANTLEF